MARRVPLVSYWDTEDYLSPPDAGSDDIILHIARSARAAGLKATFCIMGEKVRSLVGRGRTDVIREIARYHDPLLHFNYGSIHPTTAEMLTTTDWVDGVALTLAREAPGFRLLERTFGRCTGLTRHGMHHAQILAPARSSRRHSQTAGRSAGRPSTTAGRYVQLGTIRPRYAAPRAAL